MKKTVQDEVFGKITYTDGKWVAKEPVKLTICESLQEIKLEIESVSGIYDKISLGLMKKSVADLLINSGAYNEEKALKDKELQKTLFNSVMSKLSVFEKNIEESAIQELEEVIQDYDLDSFGQLVGKEKATAVFKAKSKEEKLRSLKLTVMRIFLDRVEIKCTCDWYKFGGGFIVLEGGECLMRPIDSLSF